MVLSSTTQSIRLDGVLHGAATQYEWLSAAIPANTRHSPNVGSMLGQRRRRWTIIEPTLGECLVFFMLSSTRVSAFVTM